MNQKGFVLVTSILLVLLMLGVVGMILRKTAGHIKTSQFAVKQMESMVLAETGVSEARRIIAEHDINRILAGADGVGSIVMNDSFRNPIEPSEAVQTDISLLQSDCDDGFYRFSTENDRAILVRISNNAGESPFQDADREVIVRSIGIVRNTLLESETGTHKNQVTLLESRLRKESFSDLPSPLVLYDEEGRWRFEGSEFRVDGDEMPSVLILGNSAARNLAELRDLAGQEKPECFNGPKPGVMPGLNVLPGPGIEWLESPDFWEHFSSSIPEFGIEISGGEPQEYHKGLLKYSGGGRLQGSFTGILVTSGNVTLGRDFLIKGLLIHLGSGELRLMQNSSVIGALLYIAVTAEGGSGLVIGDQARIAYSKSDLEKAGRYLPVTHLGTRIIHE